MIIEVKNLSNKKNLRINEKNKIKNKGEKKIGKKKVKKKNL